MSVKGATVIGFHSLVSTSKVTQEDMVVIGRYQMRLYTCTIRHFGVGKVKKIYIPTSIQNYRHAVYYAMIIALIENNNFLMIPLALARIWISYAIIIWVYIYTYMYIFMPHMHICVCKLTTIGSDNGLSSCRRQANIWTNDEISLIGTLGTNFNKIVIKKQKF